MQLTFPRKFVVKTLAGLEQVLEQELQQLGMAEVKPLKRAAEFTGSLADLYRANFGLRTALRIIMPIHSFDAADEDELYAKVREVDWTQWLDVRGSFLIDPVVSSDTFTHSQYVAQKVKDAIADQFRERSGLRPSVDKEDPDLLINVHLMQNTCTISIDSTGKSLHMRGYRAEQHRAPLNEVLAAGMLLLSGFNPEEHKNFVDPFCGSATTLIEAVWLATNTPPGILRNDFQFQKWPNFDRQLWRKIKRQALRDRKPTDINFSGTDISADALDIARANVEAAGLEDYIRLSQKAIMERQAPAGGGVVLTNPPYGERLQPDDIEELYSDFGDTLKQEFAGYTAWVLSSDADALKSIGLQASKKIDLFNGALPCQLQRFELYEGSRVEAKV